MTDYMTEEEQVELIKSWVKQYGLVVLSGIAIAVVLMTGWRYWKDYQARILSQASSVYTEMLTYRAQDETKETTSQANRLTKKYRKTVYSELASLMLAREAANHQQFATAEKHLHLVINNSRSSSFRQIARLRLARLTLENNQPQAALDIISKVENKQFSSLIDEVRGDIYLAMNKTPEARASYKKALDESSDSENIRPLLQMKYDDLATLEPATNNESPL